MRLREYRLKARLTQVQLAELSGVAQTHITKIETGKVTNPTWNTVRRLCEALGQQPQVIFPNPDRSRAA